MTLLCRVGSEEFCILFPHTTKNKAITLANRLRKKFELLKFHHASSASSMITISIGVSTIAKGQYTKVDAKTLLNQAD